MENIKRALGYLVRGETDLANTCLSAAWNEHRDLEISHGLLRTVLEDIDRQVPHPTMLGQKEQLLLIKKLAADALDMLKQDRKQPSPFDDVTGLTFGEPTTEETAAVFRVALEDITRTAINRSVSMHAGQIDDIKKIARDALSQAHYLRDVVEEMKELRQQAKAMHSLSHRDSYPVYAVAVTFEGE